jgi:hypothetical protein
MTAADERADRITIVPPAYHPIDFDWDAEEPTVEVLVLPEVIE